MTEAEIKAVLETERLEWMTKIREIVDERNAQLAEIKQASYKTANPDGTLDLRSRPVKLSSLRRIVEAMLALREEYGQNEPDLLAQELLDQLCADLEKFVDDSTKGDARSLAGAGDIKAMIKARLAKLALKRNWWKVSNQEKKINVTVQDSPGAVVNIDSIVGHIRTNAQAITEQQGGPQFAEAITKLTEQIQQSTDLGAARGEALQNIEELSEQAKLPPAERRMGIIKSIYLGLSTALTFANAAGTAWHTYGPVIAEFFKIQ